MPTPLQTFEETVKKLKVMPFEFWHASDQKQTIGVLDLVTESLRRKIAEKNLLETSAYKAILDTQEVIRAEEFDEVKFIKSLIPLIGVYREITASNKNMQIFLDYLGKEVAETLPKLLQHHIAMENLEKNMAGMPESEKHENDLKVLQEIGIFYVLEYTLQVQLEFTRISDEDKRKLLTDGLRVEAGSLPGYLPIKDTYSAELCYKIYDEELRNKLFRVFFKFDETYSGEDLNVFYTVLKEMNLALLRAFYEAGLEEYKAMFYAPFGNNVPLDEVIKKTEAAEMKEKALIT
ncbi:hypothetical protein KJ742_01340 [Patescibacteria group bacterium]|nr:hypothetical protein [Patescibacteria group bacterium]MBU1682568.1 hypothetical protein [Patescibacteria group bacterium]MBU1934593.1 hypothetical protein [Patescibacteria group bacterium]